MFKKILLVTVISFSVLNCFGAEDEFLSLGGQKYTYQSLSSSSKTIFFMWTTWCPHCRRALDSLTNGKIPLDGIEIYYVNVGEKKAIVEKFIKKRKLTEAEKNKVILDKKGIIADKFYVSSIPVFLFFNDQELVHRSYNITKKLLDKVY